MIAPQATWGRDVDHSVTVRSLPTGPRAKSAGAKAAIGLVLALAVAGGRWATPPALPSARLLPGEPIETLAPRGHELRLAGLERAPEAPLYLRSNLDWIHPLAGPRLLPGTDSRRFGAMRDGARPECGGGHCGVDVGDEAGLLVHAAGDAVVEKVVWARDQKGGRYVRLRHAHGVATYDMHLRRIRGDLRPGLRVEGGEPIATTGNTGIHHSRPHLHFAVAIRRQGREWFLDPEPLLRKARLLPESASLPRLLLY
jgi:murein DD-endopeptidase MepM/ murein hydrolase activator NlpD